ncbi:MAG: hypothetical protein HRT45_07425 [Bdellovibrionales bacterium]|nr:hypothetical protein [Bdellovibrionales bacterium]
MVTSKTAVIIALALLTGLQLWYFTNLPTLPGSDSYYYALQASHLSSVGELKIPDHSPVHQLISSFMIFGLDGAAAVSLFVVILAAALKGLLGVSLSSRTPLLAALCLLSPSLLVLAIEFPRQFLAMFVLALFARIRISGWRETVLLALGLGLSVYLHKSMAPFVLVIGLYHLWGSLKSLGWRRLSFPLIGACLLFAASMLAMYLTGQLDRFDFGLTYPGLWTLAADSSWGTLLIIEIVVVLGLAVCYRPSLLVFTLLAVAPAIVPFFNETAMSIGERYALLLPFACYVFFMVEAERVGEAGLPQAEARWHFSWAALACLVVVFFQLGVLKHFDSTLVSDYLARNQRYERIRSAMPPISKDSLVIVGLGLNYYLKYHLELETFPYTAEDHWNKSEVWRLVREVEPSVPVFHLDGSCLSSGSFYILEVPNHFLIKEDCYQKLRFAVKKQRDDVVEASLSNHDLNPSRSRPRWLYKKYEADSEDAGSNYSALPEVKATR